VSAGKNTDQREADDIVLAANYAAESLFKFSGFVRNSDSSLGRHCFDSTIGRGERGVTYVIGPALSYQPSAKPRSLASLGTTVLLRTQVSAMLAASSDYYLYLPFPSDARDLGLTES
jgi:hypothetical protein